jgi:peptidoglycan/LPS O-acetylase OafA/YrhL
MHPGYRRDIDGLRAVAILSVVGFHALPNLLPGGFVGVDVFFVISGYLISGIILESLAKGSFSFREFYARRVRRIFPALAVVLAVSYAIGWFLLFPDEFSRLCKHIAAGAVFIANFALRREGGYFDMAAPKPMLHLWSLGIEEQFYIFWPLLLWLGWQLRMNLRVAIMAILVLSFGWNAFWTSLDAPGLFFSPLARFWELSAGALLAHFRLTGEQISARPATREALAIIGVLLVAGAFARESSLSGWSGLLPAVSVLGAMLLIAVGPQTWINRVVLGSPAMIGIGLISYPLYLWHWPLLSFANVLALPAPDLVVRGGAVLLAVLLAWLTYRFIEIPVRFGDWRYRSVPALATALATIMVLAVSTWQLNGLPGRFPTAQVELANYQHDTWAAIRNGICLSYSGYARFDECIDLPADKDVPLVLLWGDSHAAHLYPGLKQYESRRIAEFTTAACAPIPGVGKLGCVKNNDWVIARAAALKPSRVILAADWGTPDWHRLDDTLGALRRIGVEDVVIVGPVPKWRFPLPKALVLYATRYGAPYPVRMSFALVPGRDALDAAMQSFARSRGAAYVSPYQALCNDAGCRTFDEVVPDRLIAFDESHLTVFGSNYVVRRILAGATASPP